MIDTQKIMTVDDLASMAARTDATIDIDDVSWIDVRQAPQPSSHIQTTCELCHTHASNITINTQGQAVCQRCRYADIRCSQCGKVAYIAHDTGNELVCDGCYRKSSASSI